MRSAWYFCCCLCCTTSGVMQLYQMLSRTIWLWDKWLLYFHICSCTCIWSILCSVPYSCWELRSCESSWSAQSNLEEAEDDPGGQKVLSKLYCVSSSFYPISIPFSSNLKSKPWEWRLWRQVWPNATNTNVYCYLKLLEILLGNRALNFILGKIGDLFFYSGLSRSSGTLLRELSFPELSPTQTCSVGDCN